MHEPEIRSATDGDIPGIVALVAARLGDDDAAEAEMVLRDPAFGRKRWLVAVDEDKVLSTSALFAGEVRHGPARIGAAHLEFVATDAEAEGRGLVRRQLDVHHERAPQRGEHIIAVVGIRYFYRRFGYEYAVPTPDVIEVDASAFPHSARVREATTGDIDSIIELHDRSLAASDTAVVAARNMRRWIIQSPAYRTFLLEEAGQPLAATRLYWDEDESIFLDTYAPDAATLRELLGGAAALAPADAHLLSHRPCLTADVLDGLGMRRPDPDGYYLRAGDRVHILNALRPSLEQRLQQSELAETAGTGLISLFVSSLEFDYRRGRIGPVRPGPPVPYPVSAGGSGVPPDLFATLLFGPLGAVEMERRYADVVLGSQSDLMRVLFPPQTAEIQSWVPPY